MQIPTIYHAALCPQGVSWESFVGFIDVSLNKTMSGLFSHVNDIMKEFKIDNKLVGQSYEGTLVMNGPKWTTEQTFISTSKSFIYTLLNNNVYMCTCVKFSSTKIV